MIYISFFLCLIVLQFISFNKSYFKLYHKKNLIAIIYIQIETTTITKKNHHLRQFFLVSNFWFFLFSIMYYGIILFYYSLNVYNNIFSYFSNSVLCNSFIVSLSSSVVLLYICNSLLWNVILCFTSCIV